MSVMVTVQSVSHSHEIPLAEAVLQIHPVRNFVEASGSILSGKDEEKRYHVERSRGEGDRCHEYITQEIRQSTHPSSKHTTHHTDPYNTTYLRL